MNPQIPQSPQPNPEHPQNQSPEQANKASSLESPLPAAPTTPPTDGQIVTPLPQLSVSDVTAAIAAMPAPNAPVAASLPLPSVAADDDLIEPEWVDKTEEVISQTSGNPYAEEEAIEDLQVDYLQKRYGHKVMKPEDK
jgi:hypothetical protein